jgi:hypothetical protein
MEMQVRHYFPKACAAQLLVKLPVQTTLGALTFPMALVLQGLRASAVRWAEWQVSFRVLAVRPQKSRRSFFLVSEFANVKALESVAPGEVRSYH